MTVQKTAGFTLIELIMVMIIVGVVASFAATRLFSSKPFEDRGFFDTTQAAVRYAQKLAISSSCDTQIQFNASSFTIVMRDSCTTGNFVSDVAHPGSGASTYTESYPSGVSITTNPATFYFNSMGAGNNCAASGVPANVCAVITIGSRVLTVIQETGFAFQSS